MSSSKSKKVNRGKVNLGFLTVEAFGKVEKVILSLHKAQSVITEEYLIIAKTLSWETSVYLKKVCSKLKNAKEDTTRWENAVKQILSVDGFLASAVEHMLRKNRATDEVELMNSVFHLLSLALKCADGCLDETRAGCLVWIDELTNRFLMLTTYTIEKVNGVIEEATSILVKVQNIKDHVQGTGMKESLISVKTFASEVCAYLKGAWAEIKLIEESTVYCDEAEGDARLFESYLSQAVDFVLSEADEIKDGTSLTSFVARFVSLAITHAIKCRELTRSACAVMINRIATIPPPVHTGDNVSSWNGSNNRCI
jgi:hypothetical protein